MIKVWRCTAQVDMCAERLETVIVKANTERKAIMKATELLKKKHFHVAHMEAEEIENDQRTGD